MESRRKEEFELKVFNGESKDDNEHNEKSSTRQICQKYGFITKYRPSQNHRKRRWQYLRKQTLETSITEQGCSSPGNKTKYAHLRTNCVTKKTWLLLQRIALSFMVSSLVLITNMGTTIIYLKDVIPLNHPGDEKLLAKIQSTNVIKQKSINTVPRNDVPDVAAHNVSRNRGGEFKIYEVYDDLKPLYFTFEYIVRKIRRYHLDYCYSFRKKLRLVVMSLLTNGKTFLKMPDLPLSRFLYPHSGFWDC